MKIKIDNAKVYGMIHGEMHVPSKYA